MSARLLYPYQRKFIRQLQQAGNRHVSVLGTPGLGWREAAVQAMPNYGPWLVVCPGPLVPMWKALLPDACVVTHHRFRDAPALYIPHRTQRQTNVLIDLPPLAKSAHKYQKALGWAIDNASRVWVRQQPQDMPLHNFAYVKLAVPLIGELGKPQ